MRFQVLAGRTETEPSRRHLSMCVCVFQSPSDLYPGPQCVHHRA